MDRRFEAIDRRFVSLESEIRRQAEETRRHFDVVAESLKDDFRIFADATGVHSGRLDGHDVLPVRLLEDDPSHRLRNSVTTEQQAAGEHFVQDDAECPDVRAPIDDLALGLLGGHVGSGTENDAARRHLRR
ncbi:MAG TPA: hypothetical protein VM818_22815 [Vicinamibacterales bacterium]|nr:hypothetical protein [Vicinamibacterales bacterium]